MNSLSVDVDDAGDLNTTLSSHEPGGLPATEINIHQILEALPEPIYMTDAGGRITFYNSAAERMWGVAPDIGKSEFCGSWKLHWPDGRPLPHGESPMAIALREQRPNRGKEAIAERPDGTRVPFLAFPTPLFGEDGNLVGAVNMLIDLSERVIVDEAAQRFTAIVESSDDAILAKDLNGMIITWNRGAERLFGYTADEAVGRHVTMLIPLDRHNEEPDILGRIRRGERIDHYETIRRRKDGSLIEISLSVSPIRNREGQVIGASKIARDITERRRAEEQQHLLIREMDHRVKNLFTLASSVVSLSARSASTSTELAGAVRARLNALAQAHALTVPSTSEATGRTQQATTLHRLVSTILAPYDNAEDHKPRAVIAGPDISISGSAVTSFALLLHEFATNAAKYGALSVPEGIVDISCHEQGGEFVLRWTERDGPPVLRQTDGEGFGTVLGKATVRNQLGGEIIRDWKPEGLSIRLSVSRDRLASP
jgi:PAS domain S-box-containing protein